jgi:hypothetical protein
MTLEGFKPQFYKLKPAIKINLQANSSIFFHYEIIEIDEKYYNDPAWIIWPPWLL